MKWARTESIGGRCKIYDIESPDTIITICYGAEADAIIEAHNQTLEHVAKVIEEAPEPVTTQ